VKTPDVTKAQVLALMQAAIATAVAFGAPLTDVQQAALMALAVFVVLVAADVHLRRGRAKYLVPPPELDQRKPARPPARAQLDAIREEADREDAAHAENGDPVDPGTPPEWQPGAPSAAPARADSPRAGLQPDE
jgi:hypothetical protein